MHRSSRSIITPTVWSSEELVTMIAVISDGDCYLSSVIMALLQRVLIQSQCRNWFWCLMRSGIDNRRYVSMDPVTFMMTIAWCSRINISVPASHFELASLGVTQVQPVLVHAMVQSRTQTPPSHRWSSGHWRRQRRFAKWWGRDFRSP